MQNRFRSPVVWFALLAQLLIVVGMFMPEISDNVRIIGTVLIEACTVMGILNNPTNGGGW